jgi:acetylornithine deacetylase/succinyl-diaminopimelate desuccinylase family protein
MATPKTLTRLLQDLIRIPSVNPAGDPGTDQVGEQAIAEYVGDFLRRAGADVSLKAVEKGRPNVLGVFSSGARPQSRVAFAPHLDTVSVAGMTVKPFGGEISGERIWGRGASDTKGPMAAMLWALKLWSEQAGKKRAPVELTFAGLMGEEAGNDGAIALARSGFKSDLVVVGEPTEMKVVYATKGALWITIQTKGQACHASTPEKGDNAIYKMRRVLAVIEDKIKPQLLKKRHPELGGISCNVGTIRGGSKVNIVPDHCEVEVDFRTIPTWSNQKVLAWVTRELQRAVPGVVVKAQRSPSAFATDPQNPWVQGLARQSRGLAVAPWFCDAAIFAEQGLVSVAFGPGSIAQAHTKDEFIRLKDLEQGSRAYLKFLHAL